MFAKTKNASISLGAVVLTAMFFIGSVSISQAAAENDGMDIVYVDIGKIFEVHPAFIKAQEEFGVEVESMQKEMQGMTEEEQVMAQQQMQQQMQQRGEQLQKTALEEMKKDLQKIAAEKGYDYIFDANSLIVGGKDVTDEILEELK